MTPRRAAAYTGGTLLMAAWLASAAGTVWQQSSEIVESAHPVQTTGTESLATDVQSQAARLKERLAAAPAPQHPSRNPFAFASREAPVRAREVAPVDLSLPEPTAARVTIDPQLALIGVAEDEAADGIVRTAIITAEGDELFIVKVGDSIGGRYTVTAIGADAVELSDRATAAVRRLALR